MADPINGDIIVDIVTATRETALLDALYAHRAGGNPPVAQVAVSPDGSVRRVSLRIGSVTLYFHATKDAEGQRLEPRSETTPEWVEWFVPFDGYEVAP